VPHLDVRAVGHPTLLKARLDFTLIMPPHPTTGKWPDEVVHRPARTGLADAGSGCVDFHLPGRLCCRGDGRHPGGGNPASFVSARNGMRPEGLRSSTL